MRAATGYRGCQGELGQVEKIGNLVKLGIYNMEGPDNTDYHGVGLLGYDPVSNNAVTTI